MTTAGEKTKFQGKGIKKISTALASVVEPVYKARGFSEAKLISDWEQIVGSEIAAITTPVKLSGVESENRALTIKTSSAHALEVQHLESVILERIAAYMGYKAIGRIKIKQE